MNKITLMDLKTAATLAVHEVAGDEDEIGDQLHALAYAGWIDLRTCCVVVHDLPAHGTVRWLPDVLVTCMGLPVPGFPERLIDWSADQQIVRVPFIVHRGCTYGTGAYVLLHRMRPLEYRIEDVALQPHLLQNRS